MTGPTDRFQVPMHSRQVQALNVGASHPTKLKVPCGTLESRCGRSQQRRRAGGRSAYHSDVHDMKPRMVTSAGDGGATRAFLWRETVGAAALGMEVGGKAVECSRERVTMHAEKISLETA